MDKYCVLCVMSDLMELSSAMFRFFTVALNREHFGVNCWWRLWASWVIMESYQGPGGHH